MFFSVIVPAYNRASKLLPTLNSILQQTFSDFELILVDDGSTDKTKLVAEELAVKDSRVKYVYQENQERCIARNNGIKYAQADWICFLDSDDFYMPNHLEELHNLILAFPLEKAFATSIRGASISNPKEIKNLSFKDFWKTNNLNLAQLCYNKRLLPGILFPNERMRLGEDLYFIRTLALQTNITQSPVITVYKNEEAGRSDARINQPQETAYEFLEATEKFVAANNTNLSKQAKSNMLSFAYLVAANILIATRNKKQGVMLLKQALDFSSTFMHSSFYKALIKLLYK